MSIVISDLSKNYGSQKAIDSISFSVNDHEIVGFLGPNGAGKSTTMKIIAGYILPDAGKVKVNEFDISIHPLEAKRKIGYLPESNPLYFEMYVKEYLELVCGIHQISFGTKKRINEVIDLTGLTPEHSKKIGQLSKGYKQRVGLAAALIHDPEILILDEPTSGLDPNQIVEIRDVIKNLGQNKTVLFSSHILQEVESICDRLVIINKGTIVADDTLANLREQQNSFTIVAVEFAEKVNEEILATIDGVLHMEKVKPSLFRLQTNNPDLLKKELLSYSIQNNLNIISLQSETKSLENVFRHLTGNIQNN